MTPLQIHTLTPPEIEPISLLEAKDHLRVRHDLQDDLIEALIRDARTRVENLTQRPLITQTLRMDYARFPSYADSLALSRVPVQSVDSLTYLDSAAERQTLDAADYDLLLPTADPIILPRINAQWPAHTARPESIQVTVTAGYGDTAEDVPGDLRRAILLLIGHWHENAELSAPILIREVPRSFDWITNSYRYFKF